MDHGSVFISLRLRMSKLLQRGLFLCLSLGLNSCSVFTSSDPINDNEIVVSIADGDHWGLSIYDSQNFKFKSKLWDDAGAHDPTWSPDGSRIAFSTWLRATSAGPVINIIDRRTGEVETLSNFIDDDSQFPIWGTKSSWSKSSNILAFLQCTYCSYSTATYILLIDMETRSPIPFAGVEAHDFEWNRAGDQIAFTSQQFGEPEERRRREVMVGSVGSEVAIRLSHTDGLVTSLGPSWSSDSHISFVVDSRTVLRHELSTGRIDTLWNGQIGDPALLSIRYSNQGDFLAMGFQSGKIIIIDREAKIVQEIEFPALTGEEGFRISKWSPDDSGVLVLHSTYSPSTADLYFVSVATGEQTKLISEEEVGYLNSDWKPQ